MVFKHVACSAKAPFFYQVGFHISIFLPRFYDSLSTECLLYFELSHIIPKCVNNIFLFYLANGIQRGNEHHKEYAKHTDSDAVPRKHKLDVTAANNHSLVNQPREKS